MNKYVAITVRKVEEVTTLNLPKEIAIKGVIPYLRYGESSQFLNTSTIVHVVDTIVKGVKKDFPFFKTIYAKETSPYHWTFYVEYEESTLIESLNEGMDFLKSSFA